MAAIWALLAAIAPGFATATDAADTGLRMLLKTPASIADIGIALLVAYALRDRPRWAAVAAVAILLHPAIWYLSAWWGQYESIYVLPALAAAIAAGRGRNGLAAALVTVSLLAKPQAVAFVLPFAAWFWASGWERDRWRGAAIELGRTGLVALAVGVVAWVPFIGAGGPMRYLDTLSYYQNEVFNVLSLRAWNLWWLVQQAAADGRFIADDVAFLGPFVLRHVGYAVTGVLEVVIMLAIVRDRRPGTLILGLAASTLVFFAFMTQMHERYAYAAVVFLTVTIPDRRGLWLAAATGVVFTLNLVAAAPPTPDVGRLVPIAGPVGIVGSVAMIAIAIATLRWTASRGSGDDRPAPTLTG
jgi:ALG6, ALG8 glycosyltransferase family